MNELQALASQIESIKAHLGGATGGPQLTQEQIQMRQRLAAFAKTPEGQNAIKEHDAALTQSLQKWEQSKQQPQAVQQAPQAGAVTAEQFQEAMGIIKRQGEELASLKKSLGETN